MSKQVLAYVIAAIAGLSLVYFGPGTSSAKEAENFHLYTSRGKLVSLEDYRGSVVVLDFYASWCRPCRQAIPAIERIHETYKDRGVHVMGINVNDDADVAEFMDKMGMTYPVLIQGDDVARSYSVRGIPTLIIISAEGEILFRESGWSAGSEREMSKVIEDELSRIGK